jgi:sugar O-acyltransferase (sialic acid O-acetyltransferase NeuD family)
MKYKVPFITSNEEEVRVVKILTQNGEKVKKNQKIFILETTKTSYDVEALSSGFVYFNFKIDDHLKSGNEMYEISETKKNIEEKINKDNKFLDNKIITDDAKKIINEKNIDVSIIEEKLVTKETLKKYLQKKSKNQIPKGNKKSAIIVGASNHGKTVYDFLTENKEYEPLGFINYDSNFESGEKIFNLGVFNLEDLEDIFKMGTKNIYINTNNFNLTKKIYLKAKEIGYKFISIIHKTANVSKISKLGECVFIGPFSILGTGTEVGPFTKILNKASVAHDSIIGENVQISDGATVAGNAVVGDNTLIGINSAVINKCKIGKDVIVISGKTVTSNLDDGTIYR